MGIQASVSLQDLRLIYISHGCHIQTSEALELLTASYTG